jgi:TRAP-type C4-dicarboxylate transport system substrate-binding protein
MYKEFPEVNKPYEDANMIRVTYFGVGNYHLLGKKKIATLEDFKGQKIRASGGTATMVKAVGGTVVGMSSHEAYDALDKGLLDATTGSISLIYSLKQYEVAKQLVMYYFWANPSAGIMMNLDVWKSLSPDVQNVFMELLEEYPVYMAQLSMESTDVGLEEFTSKYGVEITEASADVIEEWSNYPEVQNISDDSIARMVEQSGLPEAKVREMLARYMELLEENVKLYPQEF